MQSKTTKDHIFTQRLDFYWQSLVIYAIVLIGYIGTKGIMSYQSFSHLFSDPIVLLFLLFILISIVSFLFKWIRVKSIIVQDDFIIFKNRFREKKIMKDEIEKIFIGRVTLNYPNKRHRLIKIFLKDKIRRIRIRPTSYWDDKDLVDAIINFRKRNLLNK